MTAESTPSALPVRSSTQALLVTLAAIVALKVFEHVPIAGIDAEVAAGIDGATRQRLSVMVLGLTPWLSALALFELAYLLVPPLRRWRDSSPDAASAFDRGAMLLALVFAVFQALGIAGALGDVPGLVIVPPVQFTFGTVASLVGATAFAMMLAAVISRHGIANGFWVLFAATSVASLRTAYDQGRVLIRQGAISPELAMASLALALTVAAILVAIMRTRESAGFARADGVVWPPLLASLVGGFAAFVVPGVALPVALLIAGAATTLLALLYPCPAGAGRVRLVTALALGALVAATEMARAALGGGLLPRAPVLIASVAVLYVVVRTLAVAGRTRAERA